MTDVVILNYSHPLPETQVARVATMCGAAGLTPRRGRRLRWC